MTWKKSLFQMAKVNSWSALTTSMAEMDISEKITIIIGSDIINTLSQCIIMKANTTMNTIFSELT